MVQRNRTSAGPSLPPYDERSGSTTMTSAPSATNVAVSSPVRCPGRALVRLMHVRAPSAPQSVRSRGGARRMPSPPHRTTSWEAIARPVRRDGPARSAKSIPIPFSARCLMTRPDLIYFGRLNPAVSPWCERCCCAKVSRCPPEVRMSIGVAGRSMPGHMTRYGPGYSARRSPPNSLR